MPPKDNYDEQGQLIASPTAPSMEELAQLTQMGDISLQGDMANQFDSYLNSQYPESAPEMPSPEFINSPGVQTALGLSSIQDAIALQNQIANVRAQAAEQIKQELKTLRTSGPSFNEGESLAAAFATILPILAGAAIGGKTGAYAGMQAGGAAGLTYTKGVEKRYEDLKEEKKQEFEDANKSAETAQTKASEMAFRDLERRQGLQDEMAKISYKDQLERKGTEGILSPVQSQNVKVYKTLDKAGQATLDRVTKETSDKIAASSYMREITSDFIKKMKEFNISPDTSIKDLTAKIVKGKLPGTGASQLNALQKEALLNTIASLIKGIPSDWDSQTAETAQSINKTYGEYLNTIMGQQDRRNRDLYNQQRDYKNKYGYDTDPVYYNPNPESKYELVAPLSYSDKFSTKKNALMEQLSNVQGWKDPQARAGRSYEVKIDGERLIAEFDKNGDLTKFYLPKE